MKCFICKEGDEKESLFPLDIFVGQPLFYHVLCAHKYEFGFMRSDEHISVRYIRTHNAENIKKYIQHLETLKQNDADVLIIDSAHGFDIQPEEKMVEEEEQPAKVAQFKRDKFDRLKQRNTKLANVSKFFKNA